MKIACHLPEKTVGNREIAELRPGWTEESVYAKTGIRLRHVAGDGEDALDLAAEACRKLFASGVSAGDVDFILYCTQSPKYVLPGTSGLLQHRLGLPVTVGSLDYNLGCSGFVYGLALAKGLVLGGVAKGVLLVTAETYSKYLDPGDASSRAVFGDGAAAVFIDRDAAGKIGEFVFGTDGSGADKLVVEKGSPLFMDGPGVFAFALDAVPSAVEEVCAKNAISPVDVDLFVFHQANAFMLETLRKVAKLPPEKFFVDMEDTGNTVSSTLPIALERAAKKGVLAPGMKVVTVGFGVGLSWGASVIEW